MDRLLKLVLIFDWIFLSFCIRYWKNKSGGSVLCKNAMLKINTTRHHKKCFSRASTDLINWCPLIMM